MQSSHVCLIDSCENPKNARGICKFHYHLHWKAGTLAQFAVEGKQSARVACSIDGCDLVAKSRSWCVNHYGRWVRTGTPLGREGMPTRTVEQRFFETVEKSEGCWTWLNAPTSNGYGLFWSGPTGKTSLAHRWSYTHFSGDIPDGMHIDHLCRNRTCVNPAHLEAVTPQENQSRAVTSRYLDKGKCRHGHVLTETGITVVYGKWNRCTACIKFSNQRPRVSRSEMEK